MTDNNIPMWALDKAAQAEDHKSYVDFLVYYDAASAAHSLASTRSGSTGGCSCLAISAAWARMERRSPLAALFRLQREKEGGE